MSALRSMWSVCYGDGGGSGPQQGWAGGAGRGQAAPAAALAGGPVREPAVPEPQAARRPK